MCELGPETTSGFLVNDGEASWLLLLSSFFIIPGRTLQPENTYSCILKVTGHVENRKRWGANMVYVAKHLPYKAFLL